MQTSVGCQDLYQYKYQYSHSSKYYSMLELLIFVLVMLHFITKFFQLKTSVDFLDDIMFPIALLTYLSPTFLPWFLR